MPSQSPARDRKKTKTKKGSLPGPPRYSTYIMKAFKDIKENRGKSKYKNLTISSQSLNALDLLIDHALESFIFNAEKTCAYAKTAKTSKNPKANNTLMLKHVKAATESALSGRLVEKTTTYAGKAVDKFNDAQEPEEPEKSDQPSAEPVQAD
jgi:hypothetical protein